MVEIYNINTEKIISENLYKKISCGVAFEYDKVTEQPFTVYCKGEFFGLGEINDGMFSIKTYLRED